MKHLIEFLEKPDIEETHIYHQLKCTLEEAKFLKNLTKKYLQGAEAVVVGETLSEIYGTKSYEHIKRLYVAKNLLELGWIISADGFGAPKQKDSSSLELLGSQVSISSAFLKLLEEGNLDITLPDIKPYLDHLEYLQDQFQRIEFYQKISNLRHSYASDSPGIGRLAARMSELETRIIERIKQTKTAVALEHFFKEKHLNDKEQIIFLALLKEEYSGGDDNLRDMNVLIDLVSVDEYERIKNRALLEDKSRLIDQEIVDYDEVLTPFGGITRSFYIQEEVLHSVIHPQKKKKKTKLKLENLIKEQEMFELIEPKTSLNDVVLHPKTREMLDTVLKQVDKNVAHLLKEWGVKDKKSGVEARIIFHGAPGTGKTMTALSLAKSLKKQVLSFDCSKILSMYIGESEKNVRKIFDTYKELCGKSRSEPVLLLNEADQFLSSRTTGGLSSADKMHNQMQNIFLEQIEKFDGVLIATTNLLETIDPAFSRRFNYKVKFEKPDTEQRKELWGKLLPKNAPFAVNLNINELAKFSLTGGQISLVVKNAAYKVASKESPEFCLEDFISEIQKELSGNFDYEKTMGFLN